MAKLKLPRQMDNSRINIAVIEPSQIICEGLSNILMKLKKSFYIYRFNDLEEFKISASKETFNVAIVNPSVVQNRLPDFAKLKNNQPGILWIALFYSFFDEVTSTCYFSYSCCTSHSTGKTSDLIIIKLYFIRNAPCRRNNGYEYLPHKSKKPLEYLWEPK